ncbi:MAG: hypothetical protein ACJ8F1_15875 [Polyangia bacterium]
MKSPQYVLPVEVKHRENVEVDSLSGLVGLCRNEPVKQAYLVTKREADFGSYLLGQAERSLWL